MKKLRILSGLLVLFTAISFTSCETEPVDPVLNENNEEGEQPGDPVFKVDFSGDTFTATSTTATINDGVITIGGFRGTSGESMVIVVDGATTGTYTEAIIMEYMTGGTSEYGYGNINPDLDENDGDYGTVIISNIDTANKTISGTFKYTGYWGDATANLPTVEFTNGVFENIPYTTNGTNPGPEPDPEDDTFTAKVDGVFYDYQEDFTVGVSGPDGEKLIALAAVEPDHSIFLSLYSNMAPGTYGINSSGPMGSISGSFMDQEGVGYTLDEGSVTIISNTNGWIKGTFTFPVISEEGETVYMVTEGTFNVEWDF